VGRSGSLLSNVCVCVCRAPCVCVCVCVTGGGGLLSEVPLGYLHRLKTWLWYNTAPHMQFDYK